MELRKTSMVIEETADAFKHGLALGLPAFGYSPATVMLADDGLTEAQIKSNIARFEKDDDVWDRSFLETLLLVCPSKTICQVSSPIATYLTSIGTKRLGLVDATLAGLQRLTHGPYFASPHGLFPVWKLLPDSQNAFVATLVQNERQYVLLTRPVQE